MIVVRLLVLGIFLTIVPYVTGTLFRRMNNGNISPVFCWISGQMVLWAGFLAICVPMILLEQSLTLVCNVFHVFQALLIVMVVFIEKPWKQRGSLKRCIHEKYKGIRNNKAQTVWWLVFWLLLCLQWVLTIVLAYDEGDDAFYFATATAAEKSDAMYQVVPYTGAYTGLDARHGLAPFPIWIAYLARISGIPSQVVAQILLPLALMGMTYGIFSLMAHSLCRDTKESIPFFMVLVEILFMFGGYSLFTAENFLLVRASQGKAVIACIIIPFLLYLLMMLTEQIQNREKFSWLQWGLMTLTATAACLCSTLGTILTCMMLGIAGMCISVSYRNGKVLAFLATNCIVPVFMALLYFVIQ